MPYRGERVPGRKFTDSIFGIDDSGWSHPMNCTCPNQIPSYSEGFNPEYYSSQVTPLGTDWWGASEFRNENIAWVFRNNTGKAVGISEISVSCVACNSIGPGNTSPPHNFPSGGYFLPISGGDMRAVGTGCTIQALMFAAGEVVRSDLGQVPNLSQCNGVYSSDAGQTRFGRPSDWGEGNIRSRVGRVLTFPTSPIIQPNEFLAIHFIVTKWNASGDNVLCACFSKDNFTAEPKPEARKYLWQWVDHKYDDEPDDAPTGRHWRKIKDVYQMKSDGWYNLKKDYEEDEEDNKPKG